MAVKMELNYKKSDKLQKEEWLVIIRIVNLAKSNLLTWTYKTQYAYKKYYDKIKNRL